MSDAPERILNVNDRDIPRYVCEQMLRRAGYDVISVATGTAALEAATRSGPDLVVLDVHLPDVSGLEVARRLKSAPETAMLPVLLTSASMTSTDNRVAGLDAGADGYLAQPYENAELLATVRALLRARRAERRAQVLAVELAEAVRLRDQFLSVASHELRTPLHTLQLVLATMQRHAADPAAKKRVETAIRQATRLTTLVDDLMDVTRIIAGKLPLRPEEIELDALVRDVVARFEPAAPISVTAEPARAIVDPSRLDQVITNLVSNAVKYGGGKPIAVAVEHADGAARVVVRDQGVGISAEERPHIFDRFVRAPRTAHIAGLGLGLFIAKEIVEAHGGTITVDSTPGEGSSFTVSLPDSVVEPGA